MLPSFVAHAVRYGMPSPAILFTPPSPTLLFIARHTIYVLSREVGCTVSAWHGRRHRPPCRFEFCLVGQAAQCPPDMAQRHHSARAQGMAGTILGIAVDLNAYPYLLHLLPGPTPSGRPRSVLTVPVGKERCAQVQHISSQGNSVRVGLRSHPGQAFWSGRRSGL